jgi:hypothetical protein
MVLMIKPRALCMQGEHSISVLHSQNSTVRKKSNSTLKRGKWKCLFPFLTWASGNCFSLFSPFLNCFPNKVYCYFHYKKWGNDWKTLTEDDSAYLSEWFSFFQYWGLNSGPHACTLPLNYIISPQNNLKKKILHTFFSVLLCNPGWPPTHDSPCSASC